MFRSKAAFLAPRLSLLLALPLLGLSIARAQDNTLTPLNIGAAPLFTEDEKASVLAYWSDPTRYVVTSRPGDKEGIVVVRLMPEASVWLRAYNRAPRPGSQVSTIKRATPLTDTETGKRWENWVTAKLAYDRWTAQQVADASNAQIAGTAAPVAAPAPAFPGVIPPDLVAAVGNPPAMYAAVLPRRYVVTFDDGQSLTYTDNIAGATSRNPSYRFAQGVISMGVRLREWQPENLDALFGQVGMTSFEQHVVKSVSVLEGGFDSINTYDTGFVSVGFIQFASLGDGAGSLGAVLRKEKQILPDAFQADFRRFGIDVDDSGTMVVLDPVTGAELRGAQANSKIIDDKRLIATFQRAGKTQACQTAQILVAKSNYYPADVPVTVNVNGTPTTIKVSDVIQSEAGMATLFDRKVNTGNISILGDVVEKTMLKYNLTSINQVLPYEREMIPQLRWRTDFLADKSLAQPPALPTM